MNPYRYDGRDRVLADPATGLDWLATRAYDPTTGRFLARDPLGRAPLYFADNPYAYAGNNPVSNVDPSGQYRAAGHDSVARESGAATNTMMARVVARGGCGSACKKQVHTEWVDYHTGLARGIAGQAAAYFWDQSGMGLGLGAVDLRALKPTLTIPALMALLGYAFSYGLTSALTKSPYGVPGILSSISGGLLGAFNVLFGAYVIALLTYKAIALITWAFFKFVQLGASDDNWHDSHTLSANWQEYWLAFGLIAGILAVISALVIVAIPSAGPMMIGVEFGLAAASAMILPRVKSYIDREEQAMGYTQI